jgi:hypothetical protein
MVPIKKKPKQLCLVIKKARHLTSKNTRKYKYQNKMGVVIKTANIHHKKTKIWMRQTRLSNSRLTKVQKKNMQNNRISKTRMYKIRTIITKMNRKILKMNRLT